MQRTLATAAVAIGILLPALALAAPVSTFNAARSLLVASSSAGNEYDGGAAVVVTAPVSGDLTAIGGSVISAAPVSGDALFMGGSVASRAAVAGDLRAAGGSVSVEEPVSGDVVAAGYAVQVTAPVGGSLFLFAANATASDGAGGPVTIYANNVALAGTYAGDVTVTAGGHVALAPGTVIHGALTYDAPEPADIPASAKIGGGIHYTSSSYLPSAGASRALAVASIGIFLLARILGSLILAGLLAGLFPRLAEAVTRRLSGGRARSILLTMLLGFAAFVATPIFLILLALTFIGFGIALLIAIGYALLALLSFLYAGILVGALIARRSERRAEVLWRDGVVGMFILSLAMLIPVAGMLALALLMTYTAGTLLTLFFHFAFPRD